MNAAQARRAFLLAAASCSLGRPALASSRRSLPAMSEGGRVDERAALAMALALALALQPAAAGTGLRWPALAGAAG